MRVVALAFGVLAGLVASLILSLGGLDPSLMSPRIDERQVYFGLFIIANLGVFSAGLVLASPLAGAILFLLAAIGWAGAAFAMRHGPDFVLITPPALLAIAAAFAIIAFVFRPRDIEAAEPSLVAAARADQDEAQPSTGQLRGLDQPDQLRADNDWQPGKKRNGSGAEPVFREPEDEDEESGFARFVRGVSTVLSFGLYAALAGAAVLIFLNLRTADLGHSTPVLEVRSSSSTAAPTSSASAAPPSSSAAAAPVLAPPSTNLTAEAVETLMSSQPPGAAEATGNFRTVGPAAGPAAEASIAPPEPSSLPAPPSSSSIEFTPSSPADVPVQLEPQNLLQPTTTASSSAEPVPATTSSSVAPVAPFAMSPQMAAERQQPSPAPTQAAPATPSGQDTGL